MWWKKKHKTNVSSMPLVDPLAKVIVQCQAAFAARLNKLTGHWTRRQQKVFLAFFVAGMIGICVLQLYQDETKVNALHREIPDPVVLSPTQGKQHRLSPQDSITLTRFHLRLQQLQSTPQGLDSLRLFMKQRPGFIDSVLNWEQQMKQ